MAKLLQIKDWRPRSPGRCEQETYNSPTISIANLETPRARKPRAPGWPLFPCRSGKQPLLERLRVDPVLERALAVDLDDRDVVLVVLVQVAGPTDVDLAELEGDLSPQGENGGLRRPAQGTSLARVQHDPVHVGA